MTNTKHLDPVPAIDAERYSAGHMSVLKILPRNDDVYSVILLHKDHPAIVTDETTLEWQALSLGYLMASLASNSEAQREVWENYRENLHRLELEYIENLAAANARKICSDILNRRNNHPDPQDSELLERIGIRYLNKWIARKHGVDLTDAEADARFIELED